MNTPSKGGWHRTSPFAILFFIGKIIRIIAKNAWQSIAPLFVYISVGKEDLVTKLVIGGVAIALLIAIGSVLSWLFFRYQILSDSVLIRSGVINKKQLDIKFDRIQGINTKQNPVYRYLNLVTVEFDTAGSSGSEGNLPAVTREFAQDLRKQIGRSGASGVAEADKVEAVPDTLLELDWRDMIRIGLADRRALIVFALIGPLAEQMGDEIEGYVGRLIQSFALGASKIGLSTGVFIVVALIVATFLLFAFISITAAFLRYHNFQLFLDGRTLRSSGGLLTQHEHSMDLEKIQTLRLQQGIVQSWMKRFRLTARQATSGRKHGGKQKMFTIPVVTSDQADQFRPLLFAQEAGRLTQDPRSEDFSPVSRYFMRSRILFIGLLPAILLALFLFGEAGPIGTVALLWLPLVAALSWRNWKRAGYQYDKDEIVRRSGLLGFRTVGLLFRKVQRVTVTQSRYQRRKGLASLRMYMASGKVSVPYIKHEEAQQLRDYILYRVESSQKAWH
ncbi:MAG: PH domain-containing protein [Woeseiaceae bacterium]